MPTVPVWIGDPSTRLDPRCPLYEDSKDGPRYTLIYNGVYTTIQSNLPARLSTIPDAPAAYMVDTVRLEKSPGGKGTLTVMLSPAPVEDYTMAGNSVLEVEWVEISKPLITHPIFNAATETSTNPNAGKYELTQTDLDDIAQWESTTDAPTRNTLYMGFTANAQACIDKLRKGVDSYVLYAPVCRETNKGVSQPENTECGIIINPPVNVMIEGYMYLQTADRATRDAIWSRTREWTGADAIDTDLYPESAEGSSS
jgi:hypothetical protein